MNPIMVSKEYKYSTLVYYNVSCSTIVCIVLLDDMIKYPYYGMKL